MCDNNVYLIHKPIHPEGRRGQSKDSRERGKRENRREKERINTDRHTGSLTKYFHLVADN